VRRLATVVMSTAIFLASVLVGAAFGHRAYEGWATVWSNGPKCLDEKVSLDHVSGHQGGMFWTELQAEKEYTSPGLTINCWSGWIRPPNYLKIRTTALKLSSSGTWNLCWDSGTFRNYDSRYYMSLTLSAQNSAPCGSGYYRTKGYAHILQSGNWQGGPLAISVNERHYLPCAEGATC
jgi:hypothetical protein